MKKMIDISCEDAAKDGILCKHSKSEDGEKRYRLTATDGTAYIRTEAPPTGEWQDSHWHNKVRETYIVQKGWIGYAETSDNGDVFRIYHAGDLFTTPPHIIHTVYMPRKSVIHTVKHGDGVNEERLEDGRTAFFDTKVKQIDEQKLKSLAISSPASNETSTTTQAIDIYSDSYKHFDNLIWQVPAWSTAIFALLILGISRIDSSSFIVKASGLGLSDFIGALSLLFGILHLVLSYALYKFRWHQAGEKKHIPIKPLRSPQVALQFVVNLESALLLLVSAKLFGIPIVFLISGVAVLIGWIIYHQEKTLIERNKMNGGFRSTMS